MARPAKVLTAVLASLALASCGGSDAPTEADARKTVRAYFDAFARDDPEAMCDTIVPKDEKAERRTCVANAARDDDVPPEIRRELSRTEVRDVRIDGEKATVDVRLESRMITAPRDSKIELRAADGRFWMRDVPDPSEPDPLLACIAGALSTFDESDPYWQQEGRPDFAAFAVEMCRRAYRRGIVGKDDGVSEGEPTKRESAAMRRISREVLREMIAAGRLSPPA